MPRKPAQPAPGEWTYVVGEVPCQLTAYERRDRGLAIYTRIWDGKRHRGKSALCPSIRDAAGKIDASRELVAQQKAMARHREKVAGTSPELTPGEPLTLATGFRTFTHPRKGKFPADTAHRREVIRASRLILQVLGGDTQMDEIRHRHYRTVWRHIAHVHRKSGGKDMGLRTAEIYCGVLQSAARWLQQEGHLEPGDALPAPGWKQALRTEWEQITGNPAPTVKKPRYTAAQMEKLWATLPLADPRIAMATELGAELRLGQVVRVRRSDILPARGFRIGRLRVAGRGKKRGETITLTADQRHALTRALLWGYLADAEAACRAGEIEDYYLIPGRKMRTVKDRRGEPVKRATLKGAAKPLSLTGLIKQWRTLERLAKVPHVDGRLWYGARRHQADRAQALSDVESRVKNRLGGWTKTSTREEYLEEANLHDADAAAKAREQIRPKRSQRTPPQGDKTPGKESS